MVNRVNQSSWGFKARAFIAAFTVFCGSAAAQDVPADDQDGRTVARPVHVLSPHVLRTVSLDLLGRTPLPAERERWLGRGLREYLDVVVGSLEFWETWLEEQIYFFMLLDNFRPETEGVRSTPGKLHEGRLNPREGIYRIVLSPSFEMRNPGADTFVTVAMEQLTGMTVQKKPRELEIGKTLYDGKKGLFLGRLGENQSDVLKICIESKDFSRKFIAREYQRLVHRAGEKKPLSDWSRKFHKRPGSYAELVRQWLVSEAYIERLKERHPLSNRAFVNAIHVDLLGRIPTALEAEPMREALDGLGDSAPLRSILVRLMLDSGKVSLPDKHELSDWDEWSNQIFGRFFGREASEEELDAVRAALNQPSCQPATIIYALLSHPEYHRF